MRCQSSENNWDVDPPGRLRDTDCACGVASENAAHSTFLKTISRDAVIPKLFGHSSAGVHNNVSFALLIAPQELLLSTNMVTFAWLVASRFYPEPEYVMRISLVRPWTEQQSLAQGRHTSKTRPA